MTETTPIRPIGNSQGIILTKDILAMLNAKEGDELHITPTARGIELSVLDPDFAKDMAAGEDIARRYRNTLHNLAK